MQTSNANTQGNLTERSGKTAAHAGTYNVWRSNPAIKSPTGPWEYAAAVVAKSEEEAVKCAQQRYGAGFYKAYPGL